MAGIKVNVSANTSEFQRGLDRLSAQTDRFKMAMAKRFGLADIGKGLAQGLGIGSVQQIAQLISGFFERAAKAAKEMEASTGRMLDMTLRAIALRSGPQQQIANLRKQARGMDTEIAMQQGHISDLKGNPLTFATQSGKDALTEAENTLTSMREKQAELLYQADALNVKERERLNTLLDQRAALQDNLAVSTGQISELEAAQRELGRLNANLANIKLGLLKDSGPAALAEAQNAIIKQQGVVEGLKMQERQSLFDYYNAPKPPSQLVADSLAKVGGGGRVGMSNSPQLTESKKQTNYLRQIANALSDQTAGRLK